MSGVEPHEIVPDGVSLDGIRALQTQHSTGVRKACPNEDCLERVDGRGSLKIRRRTGSVGTRSIPSGKAYSCTNCGHEFDEPILVAWDGDVK